MSAEPPLMGYVHVDAAYFIKYVRPSNAGLGAAMAAKYAVLKTTQETNGELSEHETKLALLL